MQCNKCGNFLPDGNLFCSNCGEKLVNVNSNLEQTNINFVNNSSQFNVSNKKMLKKGSFIGHIFLSFVVWNFIFGFLFNILVNNFIFNISRTSPMGYSVLFNLFWIIIDFIVMVLVYNFNKKYYILDNECNSSRGIVLILFYVFMVGINISRIIDLMNINLILQIIFVILHMFMIWFFNEKLFRRYIYNEK